MNSVIEVHELTRRFGGFTAVDGISFQVPAGETFGLLGPNGAGKTTTVRMLTTLLPITSGAATVGSFDVQRAPVEVRRLIGYVPQMLSADGALTGYENLLLFARLYGLPRSERGGRIADVLRFTGLEEVASNLVRTYSGGMVRKLEVALAMLHRPQVLFLDEPTVGLDPMARRSVWEHLRALRADFGTTIFLTTHYMEEADQLCGRVAIMNHGRIAALGTPAELKGQTGKPEATLEDAFAHFTGDVMETGGGWKDVRQTRRTARRLG